MERDMELIRTLLLKINEQRDDNLELEIFESHSKEVIVYHLNLLEQAGFTKNKILWADNQPYIIRSSLTWTGHEFLVAIKNESVWGKVKDKIKEKGGDIPMEVLKALAVKVSEAWFLS